MAGSGALGLLAVQGSYDAHRRAFEALGCTPRPVRRAAQLEGLERIVLPGGESTVLSHFLEQEGFGERLAERLRAATLAALGTCAGAILLGRAPRDAQAASPGGPREPQRLGLAPVTVRRNAYGRQRDSFRAPVALAPEIAGPDSRPFEAIFIRAPRFEALGAGVQVLGRLGDEPVLVRSGRLVLCAFHPELTDDLRIHRWFLGL
ncbi:MAG: pyridoxal 5'-phosphate synthase glutaminase subunit PdxT [Planctomycetota bacterium]|nr:MAG: pyridoxal 5'-phosphate synthase glutaminase subunit PdxT [Planctomycetota bacterium]